jgi:hypothetical protein
MHLNIFTIQQMRFFWAKAQIEGRNQGFYRAAAGPCMQGMSLLPAAHLAPATPAASFPPLPKL